MRLILGKRDASSRTSASASQSIVVSPPAGSQGADLRGDEEPLNLGSDNHVANEVIDVENEEDAKVDEPAGKRHKKTTSACWDHFDKFDKTVEVNGKKVKEAWAKCRYCTYEGRRNSRSGTSVFLNHIKMHSVKTGQQLLKVEKKEPGSISVEAYKYDQESSLRKLRLSIVMHEYPFNIVEHEYFRDFIRSLRPSFPLKNRNTIRTEIVSMFHEEWDKLYAYFKTVNSRFSTTMDMWTSNQNKGYMCVTVHWIDDEWRIQKRIIKFMHVEGRHTGLNMSEEFLACILRWFIEKKMFSLTLDNAASNEVCVNHVIGKLKEYSPLVCDGELFHVRCANHILNLVARDGLAQIPDAVSGIKAFVLAVKSSPQLEEEFYKCATECGLSTKKGLQLDVTTRWNSTYYLLRDALFFRKAFDRLHEIDKRRFDKVAPTGDEWEKALILCRCLKKFDDLTTLLSGNKYPTANLFYKGFCEIKSLISGWCRSSDATIKKMAASMQTKFDKYWKKSNLALAVAFFLDPRYKRNGIEHYTKKVHGELAYRAKVEELIIVVKQMYIAYASKYSHSSIGPKSVDTVEERAADFTEEDEDDYFQSQQGTHVSKEGETDLDKYMAESTLRLSKVAFENFDILSWWKTHQDVYPVLSMLARDVLAIQVSTVASESAFSAGGRVIDPFRSRLDPEVVEALICTKDWVAASRKGDTKRGSGLGSIVNDLEVVETLVANMSLEEQLDEMVQEDFLSTSSLEEK